MYYYSLISYKQVGVDLLLEKDDVDHYYQIAIIVHAALRGAAWGFVGVVIFILGNALAIGFKTRWLKVFITLSVISWIVEIGLVFVPPNNKWRMYGNYKKAIGSGVAKLDCFKNGTTLSMPDPSTDILYVELGGNWYPNEAAAKLEQKRVFYGYKYMSVPILHGGPLKCEFDPPIFATCIEQNTKPCFSDKHYERTVLRRANVIPYTEDWLLKRVPGYEENKENHWEWDTASRQEVIAYVNQVDEEEKRFWIIAAGIHIIVVICCASVSLYKYCDGARNYISTEPTTAECETCSEPDSLPDSVPDTKEIVVT